jgi:hypothetical protein
VRVAWPRIHSHSHSQHHSRAASQSQSQSQSICDSDDTLSDSSSDCDSDCSGDVFVSSTNAAPVHDAATVGGYCLRRLPHRLRHVASVHTASPSNES